MSELQSSQKVHNTSKLQTTIYVYCKNSSDHTDHIVQYVKKGTENEKNAVDVHC